MGFFLYLRGLARSASLKRGSLGGNDDGREVADSSVKVARKNDSMFRSTGTVGSCKTSKFVSVCSKRGAKGTNQDCFVVWEEYGCQEDMIFCGVFDGHRPWGHLVAKRVGKLILSSLLCYWQEAIALGLQNALPPLELDDGDWMFDLWNRSYLKTHVKVDHELKQHCSIDCYQSECTALAIVKHGDHLLIANVGDCRAVLARASDTGILAPIQLTVNLKLNLHQEATRIKQSLGQVFCMHDEPGLYRMWMPNGESPGLAVSSASGYYCNKDFGLISIPDVSHHRISSGRDRFMILATNGI